MEDFSKPTFYIMMDRKMTEKWSFYVSLLMQALQKHMQT